MQTQIPSPAPPAPDLLLPFSGKWVAVSPDGKTVIAAAENLLALDQLVQAAGHDPDALGYQRVGTDEDISHGSQLH